MSQAEIQARHGFGIALRQAGRDTTLQRDGETRQFRVLLTRLADSTQCKVEHNADVKIGDIIIVNADWKFRVDNISEVMGWKQLELKKSVIKRQ